MTCYAPIAGVLSPIGGTTPCGNSEPGYYNATSGVQLCCVTGDTCGANSLCKWAAGGSHPALGSGFYVGPCTDPTFQDPICRRDCTNYAQGSDIVYVRSASDQGTWACCGKTTDGSNAPNCTDPLNDEAFVLGWAAGAFPGPVNARYTPAASTSISPASSSASQTTSSTATSSTSTLTSSATIYTSSTPTSSTSTSSTAAPVDHGLSTGAEAGIGVGVGLGVLALVGLGLLLWCLRKRKRQPAAQFAPVSQSSPPGQYNSPPGQYPFPAGHYSSAPQYPSAAPYSPGSLGKPEMETKHEVSGRALPMELPATKPAAELEGS